MKTAFKLIIAILFLPILACQTSQSENETVQQGETNVELEQELLEGEPLNAPKSWHAFFHMNVPARMQEMETLNPDAIVQYSYAEEVEGIVKEHYLLVMMQEKASINGYPDELFLDATIYNKDAVNAFRSGSSIEKFVVVNEPVKVESRDGMDYVINEIEATVKGESEPVKLYYQMAIFEGNLAFYQVLTWCVFDQRDEFKADMENIISSFKEK